MLSEINGYRTKPEWFIGKGSFGSVYKAEKEGKFYAIKVFQSELLKTEYKARLDREIKAIQKISHPNVVKLYDFGIFKEQDFEYFYIVMDFIDGKSLCDYVGTIAEDKCVKLIESVLDTLESVHKSGVIHRDLKPANIIVNKSGVPILLDFGLAKLIDYSSITQTGERVGTFYYMSPEQVTDSKNIDNRSDYFAIGIIFYELLTGVLPYDAANLPALIDQIKNQYPQNPTEINPSISNQIENIILKLLEKEPYKRFQTVQEIKVAINTELKEQPKKFDLSIKNYLRLLHTDKGIFEEALKKNLVENVMFPANFFKFYHPTVDVIKQSKIPFTTDPATNRLPYSAFSKTAGVKDLPYSSGSEVTPLQGSDLQSITQVQEYVKKVIDYQLANGVNQISAPFFFAKNTSDQWFDINIKLLKESKLYRDQHCENIPLWGNICMNVENWFDEKEKTKILNYYIKTSPDGFFVYGDPICNQSNLPQLYHFTDLLIKLQKYSSTPVIVCRTNGLGLILLCLGISGISSGIASLDNFKESILSDTQDGYANDPRYYIPDLLSMVTLKKGLTSKLMDIGKSSVGVNLACDCQYCKGINSGSITLHNIKLHYLQKKKEQVEEIISTKPDDRLSYIEDKVQKALEYKKILTRERVEVGDFSHLDNWYRLIEEFKKTH